MKLHMLVVSPPGFHSQKPVGARSCSDMSIVHSCERVLWCTHFVSCATTLVCVASFFFPNIMLLFPAFLFGLFLCFLIL